MNHTGRYGFSCLRTSRFISLTIGRSKDHGAQLSPRRARWWMQKIRGRTKVKIRRDPLGQRSASQKIVLGLVETKFSDQRIVILRGINFDHPRCLAVDLNGDRRLINRSGYEIYDKPN